ncbi:OmpA family protein [Pedobacter sp. SL55]|uniref:OmpA family protein n=1 Tax=Pedobacter sp. SL55 TaxID=2995161 RepID=UPI00226F27E1|nr:OmpA family protein [Pedobacter sp. SL55]WAC39950.1 OmpA family protein [Pedobacter sp. SL55]
MRRYLFLIFFCFSISVFGQSTIKKAQNSYEDAQQFVRQNIFDEAIKHLNDAIKADPKFQNAYLQLGDIYKRLRNVQKAKENYRLAVAAAPIENPNTYFILGETELQTGDYTQAKTNLENFLAKALNVDEKYKDKAKKYIADCNFALTALKNPVRYEPFNMGFYVNSEDRDYFPALTADGQTIIFTRNVKGNEDFYTSVKKNGEWQKAQSLSENINTPSFNEGAQSISPDGRYLFFTGCNRPDGLGRCDIYVCRREGNDWSKPINLGQTINTGEWESQPSISADGSTLYFLSNRPGGFGGYDIWKSVMDDEGYWTTPINLGPNVNTPYDEATPFIHPDGKTLYFSSDGWPGLGQKDIFYSKVQVDGTFSKAVNLGYPINTFNDEFGFIVSANGTEGLFSSNLDGGFGDVDIYRFKLPENLKPEPVTYVKGVVKDAETKETLAASVLVINLNTKAAAYNEITDKVTGDFMAVMPANQSYAFSAFSDGYLLYSKHFDIKPADANKPFELEILLEKIKVGSKVLLNNIFFDTNKFDLLSISMVELNILTDLLKNNAGMVIEIQGHTDDVGDIKANQKLSENRARAVYDYLISNGIDKKQLNYKGYGETQPAFDNKVLRKASRKTEEPSFW